MGGLLLALPRQSFCGKQASDSRRNNGGSSGLCRVGSLSPAESSAVRNNNSNFCQQPLQHFIQQLIQAIRRSPPPSQTQRDRALLPIHLQREFCLSICDSSFNPGSHYLNSWMLFMSGWVQKAKAKKCWKIPGGIVCVRRVDNCGLCGWMCISASNKIRNAGYVWRDDEPGGLCSCCLAYSCVCHLVDKV